MDPLVRASVAVQQLLGRCLGLCLAAGFGAWLVWSSTNEPELPWHLVMATLWALSTAYRARRRLGRLTAGELRRFDLELFTHLVVGVYGLVMVLPGGLLGPYHPLVYLLMVLAAGYTGPATAATSALSALLLEGALLAARSAPEQVLWRLLPHGGLLAVFTTLNLVLFRAELARVRRLSREHLDAELLRMKEAARSYRLIGAPGTAAERPSAQTVLNSEERVLQSSVQEIHAALHFALELLRRSMKLRTALLLWLDQSAERLVLQEASSSVEQIHPVPLNAKEGLYAAALSKDSPIQVLGARACKQTPYYAIPQLTGMICAAPVIDHGHARGLLVVDRQSEEELSAHEQELLQAATHYCLRAVENERVFVQLERAKHEQDKLYRAANALSAATTEAQVVDAGVTSAREFAAFDFAVVTLFDGNGGEHEICAVSGNGTSELLGKRFRHNNGLVSMVVANRHPLPYRGDFDATRQVVFSKRLQPPPMPALLVLPLIVHDKPLGTLVLGSKRKGTFSDAVRPTLEVLASHMAVSLANARMLNRLSELATTDGLTGLLNKRALTETGHAKLRSAARFNKPLCLLICDIDHFKKVNDTYGHDVGDQVIKGFAEVLKRAKRDTDVVGRFGGEEFVLVCEHTDVHGAQLLAERIRTELQGTSFQTELGSLSVTCSVGVAPFPAAGGDWELLFKAADEALYASKRGGRNRVSLWNGRDSSAQVA